MTQWTVSDGLNKEWRKFAAKFFSKYKYFPQIHVTQHWIILHETNNIYHPNDQVILSTVSRNGLGSYPVKQWHVGRRLMTTGKYRTGII